MTKRIAILMGGWSAEREVSLMTGKAVTDAVQALGYAPIPIDVKSDVAEMLAREKPDIAFNALHGKFGEDGGMQGVLEMLQIPYTHSGVLASALAMHKPKARELFAAHGIPVAAGKLCSWDELLAGDPMPRPYVIKPINEGSSVGVTVLKDNDTLPERVEEILVEKYIPGRELTVAVLGEKPLAVTEICTSHTMFDYEAKYTSGHAEHIIPALIPSDIYDEAMALALKAHKVLGCSGLSRTDFRYDDTEGSPGKLFVLELNTQPGMTPISLSPEQAAYVGIDFPQLINMLLMEAKLGH